MAKRKSTKTTPKKAPKKEMREVPAIALRAIALTRANFVREMQSAIVEAADASGVKLEDGWVLNDKGTHFVK